jgi:hypothetical protein
MHWAAAFGNVQMMQALVQQGAGVNVVNVVGKTPLQEATQAKHQGAAQWLLGQGAVSGAETEAKKAGGTGTGTAAKAKAKAKAKAPAAAKAAAVPSRAAAKAPAPASARAPAPVPAPLLAVTPLPASWAEYVELTPAMPADVHGKTSDVVIEPGDSLQCTLLLRRPGAVVRWFWGLNMAGDTDVDVGFEVSFLGGAGRRSVVPYTREPPRMWPRGFAGVARFEDAGKCVLTFDNKVRPYVCVCVCVCVCVFVCCGFGGVCASACVPWYALRVLPAPSSTRNAYGTREFLSAQAAFPGVRFNVD